MRGWVAEVVERVRVGLAGFDQGCLDGPTACDLVEAFAELERLAGAGKTLAAGRALGSGAWIHRGSHRNAEAWLAAVSGGSVGQATATLETARRLTELPETEQTFRAGQLSGPQVEAVSAAAAADPSAEGDLLASARVNGLRGLKNDCARVAAAACRDEMAAYERIRARRSLRHWQDLDGTGRIDVRGPVDATAKMMAALEPYERALFERNRKAGRREQPDATAFDALVALTDAAREHETRCLADGAADHSDADGFPGDSSDGGGGPIGGDGGEGRSGPTQCGISPGDERAGRVRPKGPAATVVFHVSHDAYRRGHTRPGELCEIAGVGPVPVAVVRAAANDAVLKALLTDGTDVHAVVHLGRTIPERLRTAIEARDRECVIAGCHVSRHLEIDHNVPVCEGGITSYENLHRLCHHHHHEKHRIDARLAGEQGQMRLEPTSRPGRPPP